MVNFTELNELYNCLDLYIVASRFEGGPQSILECANTKPIVSTNVGVAAEILHQIQYLLWIISLMQNQILTAYMQVKNILYPGF